jgi:hypothetical protein
LVINISATPACYKTTCHSAAPASYHRTIIAASEQDRLCFGRHGEPKRTVQKTPLVFLLAVLSLGGCAGLKPTTPPALTLDSVPSGGLLLKGRNMTPEAVKKCLTALSAIQDDLITKGHQNLKDSEYVCISLPDGRADQREFEIKYERH